MDVDGLALSGEVDDGFYRNHDRDGRGGVS